MADNDASVASRATLPTLPLEIKARICELSALQDERYNERWFPGAPGAKLVKVRKNEWRGRSLAALSETSKEFNDLSAKHIFHTLTDTQIDSFEFSVIVLPKHTSRVRRVIIEQDEGGTGVDVRRAFVALPLFPNLSDLQITHTTVLEALGDLTQEPDEGQMRMFRDAFRPVARRLRTVVFDDFPSTESVVAFSAMCDSLRDITILGPTVAEQLLGDCLSTIRTLERLTLDATSAEIPMLHLPSGWPTLHALTSLSLMYIELEANSVALINQHALTLRSLTLELPDDSPPTPPPGFPTFSLLPSLYSFTLTNASSTAYMAIIAALAVATSTSTTRTTSRLTHLDIELFDHGEPLDTNSLRESLKPFRALRSFCITGLDGGFLRRGILRSLNRFKGQGVFSPMSSRADPFLSRSKPDYLKSGSASNVGYSVKVRCEAISAALAHGERLSKSYAQEENVDGLEFLLHSLGGIWGHKLLEDD